MINTYCGDNLGWLSEELSKEHAFIEGNRKVLRYYTRVSDGWAFHESPSIEESKGFVVVPKEIAHNEYTAYKGLMAILAFGNAAYRAGARKGREDMKAEFRKLLEPEVQK